MAKFRCPFCYKEHSTDELRIHCSYEDYCPNSISRAQGVFVDNKKDIAKCLKCKLGEAKYICDSIGMSIPMECVTSDSFIISVVGAKATGKSMYTGVLINEISTTMTKYFKISFTPDCDYWTKVKYYDLYYKPMYEESMSMPAMDIGKDPMIFPIEFSSGKKVACTFYDAGGECFEDKSLMQSWTDYLPNSNCIILVVDPLQISEVREKLNGRVMLPPQNTDALTVLDRVIDYLESETNNRNPKKKFDMSIAVVFTKIDALELFDDLLPSDSCLRYETEYVKRGAFIQEEFESTQNEIYRIIGSLLDDGLYPFTERMKRFKKSAFFGVSSLGCMPDETCSIEGVKPRRVLDPFLWLMAENKYIKTVKR